jgi:hypothetical protein
MSFNLSRLNAIHINFIFSQYHEGSAGVIFHSYVSNKISHTLITSLRFDLLDVITFIMVVN